MRKSQIDKILKTETKILDSESIIRCYGDEYDYLIRHKLIKPTSERQQRWGRQAEYRNYFGGWFIKPLKNK
jgi:hypothetical protein